MRKDVDGLTKLLCVKASELCFKLVVSYALNWWGGGGIEIFGRM